MLEEVSTAASVVIAAEYERSKLIVGAPPPAVNLDQWSPSAFFKLYQMGFFEAVGLSASEAERFVDAAGTVTMQIVSDDTGDRLVQGGEKIESLLADSYPDSGELEGLLFWINTAVSEALTNVSNWAYKDVNALGPRRWWLAATLDPLTHSLAVVVYDQGITIPKSLRKQSWLSDLVAAARLLFAGADASELTESQWISAALEYRRSRTGKGNRGKGLPQMADILNQCPRACGQSS